MEPPLTAGANSITPFFPLEGDSQSGTPCGDMFDSRDLGRIGGATDIWKEEAWGAAHCPTAPRAAPYANDPSPDVRSVEPEKPCPGGHRDPASGRRVS